MQSGRLLFAYRVVTVIHFPSSPQNEKKQGVQWQAENDGEETRAHGMPPDAAQDEINCGAN